MGEKGFIISTILLNVSGNAIDITGKSVKFLLSLQPTGSNVASGTASEVDAVNGSVQYVAAAADSTEAAGYNTVLSYYCAWQITGTDFQETLPNSGFSKVVYQPIP